jgi:hypothetical protein
MSDSPNRYDVPSGADDPGASPVFVRDASLGICLFAVPLASAERLLPGQAYKPLAFLPGQALLGLSCADHRDGDLGVHRAVSLFVVSRPAQLPFGLGPGYGALAMLRRRLPAFVFQHVVSDAESKARAAGLWGFPSAVQPIELDREGERVSCQLVMHGRHVLTMAWPTSAEGTMPASRFEWLSYIDGVPHRIVGERSGEGVARGRGRRVELLLGDHPLADRLRRLGLPKRPLSSLWIEHARGFIEAPVPLR